MDFISSKNIFLLTRDTLKLIDREIMKHGSRTGYIFYKLLLESGGYEKFELAEWAMLGMILVRIKPIFQMNLYNMN